MENNIEQKAIEVLDTIAAKLGTGVDHFWPLFVREQIVGGWLAVFIGLSFLIGMALLFRLVRKSVEDTGTVIVIGFLAALFSLVPVMFLCEGISQLLNPEYHALKSVLEMVK